VLFPDERVPTSAMNIASSERLKESGVPGAYLAKALSHTHDQTRRTQVGLPNSAAEVIFILGACEMFDICHTKMQFTLYKSHHADFKALWLADAGSFP
jgi:hypothetical protein